MSTDVSEMDLASATEGSAPDQNEQATVATGSAALATEPDTPLRFSLIEFLLISMCIGLGATSVLLLDRREVIILVAASTIILLLLLLLNRKSLADYRQFARRRSLQRKAELYSSLYGGVIVDKATNLMRARAVQYSQDLIDDYKNVRRNSRNIYYVFQISTIILSGVTPILVLLDKVDIQVAWIKWLPVIFPAIASIVTSLSTSFPFQENWMAANRAVELLEAEQEKFILGVTSAYRLSAAASSPEQQSQRKRRLQESVDSFIAKVNQIHLKQFVQEAEPEPSNTTSADDSAQANATQVQSA